MIRLRNMTNTDILVIITDEIELFLSVGLILDIMKF